MVIGNPRPDGRVAKAIERLDLAPIVHCVSGITDAELARNYAQAEVAVVPSLYEGFSLPAIEAMACGVPLVATTGGALPEVVGTDGVTGLLVPPDDPGALAAAIARLLDDAELRAPPGHGRPGSGARPVHLAGHRGPAPPPSTGPLLDDRPDRPDLPDRTRPHGDRTMLTVDYTRLGGGPRGPPPRPGVRLRPARLPRPPGWGPRWWPSTPAPMRSATCWTPSGP